MIQLRPYQQDIIESIRSILRRGGKSLLVAAPTGSGKTVIFATIARGAAARKHRVLILVHRREILEQTLCSLHGLGVTSGQIASGRPMTHDYVQTAMVMTIARRLNYVKRPDLIIVDECHHAVLGNTFGRILQYWRDVPRIGFTATPQRMDGRGLGETFDEMIIGPSIADLVRDGWLSYPQMFRPPEEVIENYHVKRGDFDTKEQQQTMSGRKIVGDVISHYRKHLGGLPAICFCVSVEHSHLMASQFTAAGYRSAAVWGDMPREARESAISGLGTGALQVVTSCDLISEGIDIPVIAGAILLRRTMSLGLYLQQVGRALRLYPGKKRAIILDHVGNYHLHGHVLAERDWSLDSVRRDPRKEKPPQITTCPQCYGVWPGVPKKCPDCGFEFNTAPTRGVKPMRVIEGELIAAGVDPEDAEGMAAFVARTQSMDAAKRQKALLGKAFELIQGKGGKRNLDKLREALGYKRGWTRWAWEYAQKARRKTNEQETQSCLLGPEKL